MLGYHPSISPPIQEHPYHRLMSPPSCCTHAHMEDQTCASDMDSSSSHLISSQRLTANIPNIHTLQSKQTCTLQYHISFYGYHPRYHQHTTNISICPEIFHLLRDTSDTPTATRYNHVCIYISTSGREGISVLSCIHYSF